MLFTFGYEWRVSATLTAHYWYVCFDSVMMVDLDDCSVTDADLSRPLTPSVRYRNALPFSLLIKQFAFD